jgi:cholesterol oxidase
MIKAANTAVKYETDNAKYAALPDNYLQWARDIRTPILFITGQDNRVFTDSNIMTHKRLEEISPGRSELQVFANYGHQDTFMGKNCHVDIFPRLLQFLDKYKGKSAKS